MELKQIKEMMAAMTRHGTKRLVIKKNDFELELERETSHAYVEAAPAVHLKPADIPAYLNPPISQPVKSSVDDASSLYVTSPMVGTFYSASSPDEPAFVKSGDRVDAETVVCIIEAMKVMNEVKAGVSGVVSEVLVENGHPVEFGTKLFRIV